MKIPLQDYFGDLKQEVLCIAEIKTIVPADCYSLSLKIEEKTQKRISETTLKRVFGFAATCYKSSIYTRNALAEYCGYESYSSFLSFKEKEGLESAEYKPWAVILENAHKISRFRIESNKHKSGISYNFAIERSQINQIIDEFTIGNSTACIINAPAGGGKTVGLTKWIDRNINNKPVSNKKDIYLFIKTSTLLSSSIFSFHGIHWLGYLLGLEKGEHLYEFITSYKESAPGNFYLIIDDMSSSHISDNQYHSIFCQLIEMVNYFSAFSWFKIILSMRPHVWNKNKYLIEENENARKQWLPKAASIKGFSKREIQQLNSNLNLKNHILPQLNDGLSIIQLPLYFQFYYQLKKESTPPYNPNTFDEFNILRAYLNRYVLNGIYLTEKKMLLDKLSRYVYLNENTLCIEQYKAIPICNQFPKAYEELINSGIIYLNTSVIGSRRDPEIRFQSSFLGSYFLALRFLKKNRSVFDANLIQLINNSHHHDYVKTGLLKWLIIFSIESSDFTLLNHLACAHFIKPREHEIVLFTIYSIENVLDRDAIKQFSDQILSPIFLDFALLHLTFTLEHQSILERFLKYNIGARYRILIHSSLALRAFTSLKDDAMLSHLKKLKSIESSAFENFHLNPSIQIEALYDYFKHGKFSRSALQEITSFNFYNYRNRALFTHPVILTIAFLVSNLSSNSTKPIRFLRAIQKYGILNNVAFTKRFNDFIQQMRADQWIKNNQHEKASSIQLSSSINSNDKPAIKILYILYKIKLARFKKENRAVLVKEAISLAKKNEFSFLEILIRLEIIDTFTKTDCTSENIEEHQKALEKLFKNSGFRLNTFVPKIKINSDHAVNHVKIST